MIAKRKQSIRGNLTRIIMLTSTTAVLLTCSAFLVSGFSNYHKRITADLSSTAQIIGTNSTAALTFGDRQVAREVLTALRAKPTIIAAGIYTSRGEPFARYQPNPSIAIPATLRPDGFHDRGNRLELFYGIQLDGERVGTLYLVADQRDRTHRIMQFIKFSGGVGFLSLLIALVLSWWLQGSISKPIFELARVVGLVSEDRNYSMRAVHRTNKNDEISDLVIGFNSMLAEIEQRDRRLLVQQTHLEETVALRTEELLVAKDAAERIAEANALLARESALILNTVTDGIMRVDLENRLTFLNPAGAGMLGVTVSELVGKSIHEAAHHSYPDGTPFPEADCVNTQSMSRGQSIAVADDVLWRKDGTSFPIEHSSTALFDDDGKHVGVVVMFRDVTERRAIERLKSEFVSTVSHELRTPLTSIRGALGLLSSGMLGAIEEKGRRMLAIAVSNTDRLVRLINDILDLERIDSGKVELIRGPVDANQVMVQAWEGVQSMGDEAGVGLVVTPATGALWGDSDRIIQTLTNLLGNAIKFSARDTTVTLSGAAHGAEFVFAVADQGRGVPADKLETIFDRFSQVNASDSRDKGGSGLGLAICQSIVNAHGGRIWAERNEPAGSRFQFTIPLVNPELLAQPPTTIQDQAHSSAPSILIVEDDLDLAGVMATALHSRGFRTLHAATGGEAVRICRQHQPSLIVLDLILPDMDGFAVVHALRESSSLGRLPLLVYSALDVTSADQARLRLGATEFLTKSRSSLADFERHVVRLLDTGESPANGEQYAA